MSMSVALALALHAGAAPPEEGRGEIILETKVISATVLRGTSQVTRSGKVTLPETGSVRIFCDDLPRNLVQQSLSVEGRGKADVMIVGTDFIAVREDPAETPKYKELKARLEKLEYERDAAGFEVEALQARLKFIEELSRLPMNQTQQKEFPDEVFQVEGWKGLMDFLQTERSGASSKAYELERKRRKIEEEMSWIRRELGAIKRGGNAGNRVAIDCIVRSTGNLTLEMSYISPGATWNPEYRISYDPAEKKVALAYSARISQSTGEDWDGVNMTLSTALPHAGSAPPELLPYYLSRLMPVARKSMIIEAESKQVDADIAELPAVADEGASDRLGGGMSRVPVQLASSQFSASFNVPVKVDLESGADPRRITITEGSMPVKLSLYTVPRLLQGVFVKGTLTNSLGAPLLAGTAEVYIDSAAPGDGRISTFVGRQNIDTVADGQEFPMHLGIDQDIHVEHKLDKREQLEKEGKKWKKIRYHYLITVENFKKEDVDITLQDRIPVSTMKEIKVEDVDFSMNPEGKRDDGIVTWQLSLSSGEKIDISIAYTIAFPGDWPEHDLNLE
jgi:uncharacterized protein (TIGR02231 family)